VLKADSTGIGKDRRIFYTTANGSRYIYAKQPHSRPIINLIATFNRRCSNDYNYNDRFENIT
jgi:hypothetical protein